PYLAAVNGHHDSRVSWRCRLTARLAAIRRGQPWPVRARNPVLDLDLTAGQPSRQRRHDGDLSVHASWGASACEIDASVEPYRVHERFAGDWERGACCP